MDAIGSMIVSWDFSCGEDGRDHEVLVVGKQIRGGVVKVINAFQGEEAKEIARKLYGDKEAKNDMIRANIKSGMEMDIEEEN